MVSTSDVETAGLAGSLTKTTWCMNTSDLIESLAAERLDGRDGLARPILIAGPTASGKSALALSLAERLDGIVINADSMQVYDALRILTARPSHEEEARAPHRLYGHVSIDCPYSVGRWLDDIADVLREEPRQAIIVGGTGLYFKALTAGLASIPDIPEEVRMAVRARLDTAGPAALHAALQELDPHAAGRIPASDPQRIVRAIEVREATGRTLSDWQREPAAPPIIDPRSARRIVLWPERGWLRARIDRRFEAMLAAGVLDEVRAVMELALDPDLPSYRAHGLRALIAHLNGEWTLEQASERVRIETRQYAKRQFTWFRNQMTDWETVNPST